MQIFADISDQNIKEMLRGINKISITEVIYDSNRLDEISNPDTMPIPEIQKPQEEKPNQITEAKLLSNVPGQKIETQEQMEKNQQNAIDLARTNKKKGSLQYSE